MQARVDGAQPLFGAVDVAKQLPVWDCDRDGSDRRASNVSG